MSLRSALLVLLRIAPMSGYELQKQFSQSVGYVWHAPDSQIYPELRKMAKEGLVEPEEQTRGSVATRRVYHVTDAGEDNFAEWMRISKPRIWNQPIMRPEQPSSTITSPIGLLN